MSLVSEESRAKFAADGSPLRFTGATVLCHLRRDESPDAIYGSIIENCYDTNKTGLLDRYYVQLPKHSLHMTILDTKVYRGSTDDDKEENQSSDMVRYRLAFTTLHSELQKRLPITMTVDLSTTRYPEPGETLKVPVKPLDEEGRDRLRWIRNVLCSGFGKPAPDEAYQFHITGYYALEALSQDQYLEVRENWAQAAKRIAASVPTFEIDRIELCGFENMFHFDVVESVSVEGST